MPFANKNFSGKPSLAKPIIIIVAILLIIGGAYTLFKGKKPVEKAENHEMEVNPSGLEKSKKVSNVEDVEKVVTKWIEANPQAILASVSNMQKKAMETQMKEAQKNISFKKDELFADKNAPQYAPSGYNVTIVEFFDYSCGYCKKAHGTINQLLQEDKKIRIVYKEFPILGTPSAEMATVSLAVNIVDPAAYKKFHDALMATNERGKDAAMKAAKSVGINMSKLEAVLKNDKDKINAILQSNLALGSAIGVNGTPGFVIGEELIPGAFELQTFKDKVAEARAAK
jgi:protein-disulfide isomerase